MPASCAVMRRGSTGAYLPSSSRAGARAGMPRYRLASEYCGAGLVGWPRQAKGMSVQAALEAAIRAFCGDAVTVFGAGRTDAGVHALAQVAHVDLARAAEPEIIRN